MKWLLAALLLTCSFSLATPPAVPIRPVSDEACMAWVVSDESRGESLRGSRAVLDTILARMKQRKQTACEVVTDRKQFSGYKDGAFKAIRQTMLTRLKEVSKMHPEVEGCEFFHAAYVSPPWRHKMTRCKQVGKHIFYRQTKEKRK